MTSGQSGDLRHYLHAVKRRWWLIAILMMVAAGGVYWRAKDTQAAYTATAVLLVTAPIVAQVPPVPEAGEAARPGAGTVTQDILQLIDSRPIAERVSRRLGLSGPGEVQSAVSAIAPRGTSLIRVSATATTPDRAADLANVTTEEFVAFFREANRASVRESRRFVEEQLARARSRLEAAEQALQAFKERRQMPSIAAASSQIQAAAVAAQQDLEATALRQREIEARLSAMRERLAREEPVVVASRSTSDNPVFRRYQDRLVELEIQRAALAQQYTPQHPRMEQISREIQELRSRMTTEARTAIAQEVTTNNPIHARLVGDLVGLEVERIATAARVDALQSVLRRRQAAAMSLPAAETEFNRLSREHRVLESNYTTLSTRYQEMLIRENLAGHYPASLQLIEPAAPPRQPAPSSLPRTAAVAMLAAFVLGVAATLLLESLEDTIRSAEDAERVLGMPVLAQIPGRGESRVAANPAAYILLVVLAVGVLGAAVSHFSRTSERSALDVVRSAVRSVMGTAIGSHPQAHEAAR
jgi:polysaccharide chain length determinant protein (PEP-CTERM system associated)